MTSNIAKFLNPPPLLPLVLTSVPTIVETRPRPIRARVYRRTTFDFLPAMPLLIPSWPRKNSFEETRAPPLLSPSNRVTKLKPIRFFVRDTSKPIRPSVGWESFPINPRLVVADSLLSEEEVGGMRGACNFIFFIAIFNFSGTCFHYKIFLYLSANFR